MIKQRIKNENGFMGRTHALTALATFLVLSANFSSFLFEVLLKTRNPVVFLGGMFVCIGFSIVPDFDNTKSTAISTFGIVGKGISKLLRSFAVFIYLSTRTKYDNKEPDAHRSFWHTIISSVLIGVLVTLTTSIPFVITIQDKNYTIGFFFAVIWIYAGVKLTIAVLGGKWLKKQKKNVLYYLLFELFAIVFSVSLILTTTKDTTYSWIGGMALLGYFVHIIGDSLTVSGVPLLYPFTFKGKRWFNFRIGGWIKAGGTVEKSVIIPLSVLVCFVCIIQMLASMM